MLKLRQTKMDNQAMREGGGQGDEAEGEGQPEEERPEDAKELQVALERMRMSTRMLIMAYTADTVEEQCSRLADSLVGS